MIRHQTSGYIVLITNLISAYVRSNEFLLPSPEDFKCALPDVTTTDENLDVIRFRSDFSKISEVKFPGLIGPLNERLFCKIKCIDGNWVGPLCANSPDGRFQPVLRECLFHNDQPLLAVSFKNATIDKETRFPHGSTIVVRCKHFGYYKLKGENILNCENGEWTPKFPECVPTTVVTNFTEHIESSGVCYSGEKADVGAAGGGAAPAEPAPCASPLAKAGKKREWSKVEGASSPDDELEDQSSCKYCVDMEFRLQYNKDNVEKMIRSSKKFEEKMRAVERKQHKLNSVLATLLKPNNFLEQLSALLEGDAGSL